MRYAFEEKAHELAETTKVILGLTKEATQMIDVIAGACDDAAAGQTS